MLGPLDSSSPCVAQYLLDLSARSGGPLIDLPMSREDQSASLGLTVELFCRVLTLFAADGLIGIPNPRQIRIIDIHLLEAIASGRETTSS